MRIHYLVASLKTSGSSDNHDTRTEYYFPCAAVTFVMDCMKVFLIECEVSFTNNMILKIK